MEKGAFIVFRDTKDPKDIHFKVLSEDTQIPEEQLNLRDEVDKVLVVLRMLFPDENDARFEEYFRLLLSLAQTGLVGDGAQPKLAVRALLTLKNEIVDREAGRVKNKYMKNLGKKALWMGGPTFLVALVLNWLGAQLQLQSFLFLWSGCMAGVWLSFGARKTRLRFEDLHVLEGDRLEPVVRLIFAGLLTVIFGLLFSTGAVVVKVGALTTADFTRNLQIALLIGMIFGFSETALPSALASQASSFVKTSR